MTTIDINTTKANDLERLRSEIKNNHKNVFDAYFVMKSIAGSGEHYIKKMYEVSHKLEAKNSISDSESDDFSSRFKRFIPPTLEIPKENKRKKMSSKSILFSPFHNPRSDLKSSLPQKYNKSGENTTRGKTKYVKSKKDVWSTDAALNKVAYTEK